MQRLLIAQRKDRETCKNRPDKLREEQFSKIFSSATNRSLGFMSLITTANYQVFLLCTEYLSCKTIDCGIFFKIYRKCIQIKKVQFCFYFLCSRVGVRLSSISSNFCSIFFSFVNKNFIGTVQHFLTIRSLIFYFWHGSSNKANSIIPCTLYGKKHAHHDSIICRIDNFMTV